MVSWAVRVSYERQAVGEDTSSFLPSSPGPLEDANQNMLAKTPLADKH